MSQLKEAAYTIKDDNGVYILHKDGMPTMCPFQNKMAIPQQSSIGGQVGMAINQYPCMSICPHFNIDVSGQDDLVKLSCGNGCVLKISLEEENEPKDSGKILKLS